ncbi:MAG: glycosyltransferase family 2 protein [Pirellula sp.]
MKVKEIIRDTRWVPNENPSSGSPRFSIFLPTFRRAKSGHLERAIQSVLNQSLESLELIIIDDASTDGSHEIIKSFMKKDKRVHMLHHPLNVGLPAIACYEAYLKSKGDYLGFCFDDTELERDALKNASIFLKQTNAKVAYGYIKVDERVSQDQTITHELGRLDTSQQTLIETNYIPNLGVVLHRDVPKEAGFLDPHFAIARVCDWDYWRRLSMKYEIRRMDILMGAEYGLVTGNSLGLTYPISSHLNAEWGDLERDDLLKPGAFEEYDVQAYPDLSFPSDLALKDLHQFYENKFWFKQPSSNKTPSTREKHGRIFVVGSDLSASTSLPFGGLTTEFIRLCSQYLDPAALALAEAMVISRNIFHPWAKQYLQAARTMRIPMYYYFDDNFVTLREEYPVSKEFKEYSLKNITKELQDFEGVMVPNQALVDWCYKTGIHKNILLTPPIAAKRTWLDTPLLPQKPHGTFRFCFMGGGHRTQSFENIVVPAINRLAKSIPIEMIVVGKHDQCSKKLQVSKVYNVPFDISYELTIGRLINAQIDSLIHSGSDCTLNNDFKTPNALINAWHLGAVPVVANQTPYADTESSQLGLVADWQDPFSWYEKLKESTNQETKKLKLENLDRHITERYSKLSAAKVFQDLLTNRRSLGFATIDLRSRLYVEYLRLATSFQNSRQEVEQHSFPCNGYSRLKGKSSIQYDILSERDGLSGINFRIGTFASKPIGELKVRIKNSKGNELASASYNLEKIQDNEVVAFKFDAISDSAGKTFKVTYKFEPKNNERIAIYEVNQTHKGIEKLLRRTGLFRNGSRLACQLTYTK